MCVLRHRAGAPTPCAGARVVSCDLKDALSVCPECSAPWRLHWVYVWEGGERKRRWNTCGMTREQLASKWLDRRTL